MQIQLPTLNLGSHPGGYVLTLALGITVDREVLTLKCCLIAYFNTLNCEVNLIM